MDVGTLGAPSWVDLSTPDVARAVDFYRELLGWEVEQQATPMGTYHVARVDGRDVAGMMEPPPDGEGPPTWTVYVQVADVDATVERLAAAGGTVLEPPFAIPDGRVAVVSDPTGAMFALISGPEPVGAWQREDVGAVCWVELLTRDTAAAKAFYAALFGWEAQVDAVPDAAPYTSFALDGDVVAGMLPMPDEVPAGVPAYWSVYFAVADCQVAEDRAVHLGGQVLRATTRVGDGRFVVLADPSGATFSLMDQVAG